MKASQPSQPGQIVATNGIAIGGNATVTNPTVNNFGPPPAKVEITPVNGNVHDWTQQDQYGNFVYEWMVEIKNGIVPVLNLTAHGKGMMSCYDTVFESSSGNVPNPGAGSLSCRIPQPLSGKHIVRAVVRSEERPFLGCVSGCEGK
jgi:hypothetical protein